MASPSKHPVVIRVQKLKTIGFAVASGRHTWREIPTDNADPERRHLNQDWRQVTSSGQLAAAIKSRHSALTERPSRASVACLEYLITANHDAFRSGGGLVDHDAYFRDSLAWLEAKHGKENIVAVNVQLDELTPHLVVYVVPVIEETDRLVNRSVIAPGRDTNGKQNRLVTKVKMAGSVRLSAAHFIDGPTKLSKIQTEFAAVVGAKHGLERGVEGSQANHVTTKSWQEKQRALKELAGKLPDIPVFSDEFLRPAIVKKGLFGRTEDGEEHAARINAEIEKAVYPALALAEQAKAAYFIAEGLKKALADSLEASKTLYKRFIDGLTNDQQVELAAIAAEYRLENKRSADAAAALRAEAEARNAKIAEALRRVDALPLLRKLASGASRTFIDHALAALKTAQNLWQRVDWDKTAAEAIIESTSEHHQSHESGWKAVFDLSPGHVDVTECERTIKLDQARELDRKIEITAQQYRPDDPGLGS